MPVWLQQDFFALINVIIIDVVLAGDNAIIVGLAASRVAEEMRARVILWGIVGAVVLRVAFAAVATQLLAIVGLTLAGGLILLWVCWKMYWEVSGKGRHSGTGHGHGAVSAGTRPLSFRAAVTQIVLADVSMSLDNVLAVAGAAREHPWVLVFGLVLSIALMGLAASFIARLLQKHRWIAYVGLLVILYVSLDMIYRGAMEIWPHVNGGL
jgi:YjbE family integral membrane protein